MMLEIRRNGERIAWSAMWLVETFEGHLLVAVPRLRLGHELALTLSEHVPYSTAFAKSTAVVGKRPAAEFVVVHSDFTLFKTAEPDIVNFAMLVPDLTLPLPDPFAVIKRTAEMLRSA